MAQTQLPNDNELGVLLELPNDNTGMRDALSSAYIANNAFGEAIALAEKFAIEMLLADCPEPPEFSEFGVTLGGEDEAWFYRESALPLWQRGGALGWLRQAVTSKAIAPSGAPPAQSKPPTR